MSVAEAHWIVEFTGAPADGAGAQEAPLLGAGVGRRKEGGLTGETTPG